MKISCRCLSVVRRCAGRYRGKGCQVNRLPLLPLLSLGGFCCPARPSWWLGCARRRLRFGTTYYGEYQGFTFTSEMDDGLRLGSVCTLRPLPFLLGLCNADMLSILY